LISSSVKQGQIPRGHFLKVDHPMNIRPTTSLDMPALQRVLEGTGIFPADLLPGMAAGFLSGEAGHEIWLSCETDGEAIGFCFAAAEQLADGAWNMLAIAVLPEKQGRGAGAALLAALEAMLKEREQRILIADTSGLAAFARTRSFYRSNGYAEEARIRDFWADGDDKITFWKSLK
jgi:ribosomal protein S18 acetylase RimI-like enzyme